MATAETARLFASLELQDKFTPGIKRANSALTGLERKSNTVTRNVGTGFQKAGSSMGGFIKTGLGLAGLTLGIAGVVGSVRGVLDATTEMAEATRTFAAITGTSTEEASRWVDVLGKFGLEGDAAAKTYGRLLVNAGKFTATQKAATKFSKEFGLSLVDNKGELVDSSELLKRSADFFNSNATASQKATALTKLYGKGWQQLIPLLQQGRAGVEREFKSALALTPRQVDQMQELLAVQREWNDTLGDVQVRIGVALIPTLTRAMRGLTTFFEDNQGAIVDFAQGLVRGAEEIVGAIGSLAPVARGIADGWNAIPADFRKLLLGGLVANKALKMTIGFDPIDTVRKSVTGALGQLLGRGSPANPMFTKEVGLGGVLGGAGGAPAAGGGKLGTALGIVGLIAAPLALIAAQQEITNDTNRQAKGVQEDSIRWLRGMPTAADLNRGLAAVDSGIAAIRSNPLNVFIQGDALARLEAIRSAIVAKQFDVLVSQTSVYLRNERNMATPATAPGTVRRSTPDPGEVARRRAAWIANQSKVTVNVGTDHRQNSSAAKTQLRYGPTPATSGAR